MLLGNISAVVTFHNEGLLAHKTLLGLERVRIYATAVGLRVELVIVLDSADIETTRVVTSSPILRSSDILIKVKNGDLGASRNDGVSAASGEYISIFDGDDYYSENWLFEALNTAINRRGDVIIHPDYIVSFGTVYSIGRVLDMDLNPDYPIANLFSVHPWVSSSFGKKDIYLKFPFVRSDTKITGFGFEDWHWNLELVAHGVRHISASNTAIFYRRKPSSMLACQVSENAIVRPSIFFVNTKSWNIERWRQIVGMSDSVEK